MANISAIREQLTSIAILQILCLGGAGIFTVYYTLPKLEEISTQSKRTNEVIQKYESIETDGIPFGELVQTIESVGKNTELVEIIKKSPDDTKTAITKSGSAPYLSWLTNALQSSGDDQIKLEKAKAKINTIIPTLSPSINEKVQEDSITLKTYINYIEQSIIKKFSLDTNSPLGIEGINYTSDDTSNGIGGINNAIGFFDLTLTFKTSNMNLGRFLDFIKNTGNPAILGDDPDGSGSGSISTTGTGDIPPIMSNPLITLESLSVESPINMSYPNIQNSGRVTLRIYIRGSSQSDQTFLKEAFQKKQSELSAKIDTSIAYCTQTETPCTYDQPLKNLKNKFDQFSKATDALMSSQDAGVKSIYILSQQLESLKYLENEYNTITQ